MEKEERWKVIPGFDMRYEVSTKGKVRDVRTGKILDIKEGRSVNLKQGKEYRSWKVHKLMGYTYLGTDINDPYSNRVLFKDKDPNNLSLDNLYVEDTSSLPGEIWKDITCIHGREVKPFYQVSNLGRVKSLKHDVIQNRKSGVRICRRDPEIIVSQQKDKGYMNVWIAAKEPPDITAFVHYLVASAFCENSDPEHKTTVNHIDGDKTNNKATNLEWATVSENVQHAFDTGLSSGRREKTHRPVLRLETNVLYACLTDASKAMGRDPGYVGEHLACGRVCTDTDGNVWTFKELPPETISVTRKTRECYIDEFPGITFNNLSEASTAIGRWVGYIADALKAGTPITNKAGELMHFHFKESD